MPSIGVGKRSTRRKEALELRLDTNNEKRNKSRDRKARGHPPITKPNRDGEIADGP